MQYAYLQFAKKYSRYAALQILRCQTPEFNIPHILMANLADEVREMTLEELLPGAFSADDIIG